MTKRSFGIKRLFQREFSKKFAVQRSICYNNIEQQGIASLFKLDEYCAQRNIHGAALNMI
ncbi:MAG: hypothetical protein LUI61_05760 [Firmicutes bacterium]|nr:hypothetical protein [Bacillota bacterium]